MGGRGAEEDVDHEKAEHEKGRLRRQVSPSPPVVDSPAAGSVMVREKHGGDRASERAAERSKESAWRFMLERSFPSEPERQRKEG